MQRHLMSLLWLFFFGGFLKMADAEAVARYMVQFDAKGFEGVIRVNGIPALARSGPLGSSGGAVLNPFMKKGKNLIEIEVSKLSQELSPELRIEILKNRESLWTMQLPLDKSPFKHSFEIQDPEFIATEFWSTEPVAGVVDTEILSAVNTFIKDCKSAIDKKDAHAFMDLSWTRTNIVSVSMGHPVEKSKVEGQFAEVFKSDTLVVESPKLSDQVISITRYSNSNLFSVKRKDKAAVIQFKFKDGFSVTVKNPIMGKISGTWKIVGDSAN